jgi:cell migration-inducing and hyaluronan-binding protein
VKFVNAKPVFYPLMEKKWGNDNNAGSAAYKSAVFKDKDGSLGQGPNSYVVIHDGVNDSIAVDAQACKINKTWNAAVCKGDVGRMSFSNGRGLGFGALTAGGSLAPAGPQPPVILTRKGASEVNIPVGTNVRSGIEFKATTERTSMDLNVIELDTGSWVIVEVPGFTTAASGIPVDSLDALRKASATSYYKGTDALWVKLVSTGDTSRNMGGGETVKVSR